RTRYRGPPRSDLYSIVADHSEKRGLASSVPPAFRALRVELSKIPRPFHMPVEADAEQAKKLASLGYLTAASPDARAAALPDPKDRIALLDGRPDFQRFLSRKDDARLPPPSPHFSPTVPA